jgi:hypothetical protein
MDYFNIEEKRQLFYDGKIDSESYWKFEIYYRRFLQPPPSKLMEMNKNKKIIII